MSTPSFDILQSQCRDAALGELPWEILLRNICSWVGGDRAMMLSAEHGHPYKSTASYNHDVSNISAYNQGLNLDDPRMPLSKLTRPGQTRTGQEYVENCEISKTDYFHLISKKADQLDSLHSVILESSLTGRQAISIHRSFKNEIFGQEEVERMQGILPHLVDAYNYAIKISGKLNPRVQTQDCAFLVKSDLRAVLLSGKPELILDGNPSFGWNGEKLRIKNSAFRTFLELAFVRGSQNQSLHCRIQIPNAHTSNTHLQILTQPKPQMIDWVANMDGSIVLYVSRVHTEFDIQQCELFAEIFQLSKSESRTLRELSQAGSLREASIRTNIRYETMRWHLKNIFAKTGYHSQEALLKAVETTDISNVR
jgi:DNA-binding CsgD family transcriptional regulator